MKDRVESKLQAIDASRADRGLKVRRLHKDFLARFLGRGKSQTSYKVDVIHILLRSQDVTFL